MAVNSSGLQGEVRAAAQVLENHNELSGFEGKLIWDATQPDGQPRRRLDVTRAEREFGFLAQTSLVDGLRSIARSVITWAFH